MIHDVANQGVVMTQEMGSVPSAGEPALRTTLTSREKAHQRQAVAMLQQHCLSLQGWGTSLESDLELGASAMLTPRQRQALCARTDHKQLIKAAHSVLETYRQSMNEDIVLGGL